MKPYVNYALLGAVLAITASMVSMNSIAATPFAPQSTNTLPQTSPMMGHITMVLYGADDQIKAYRQTDNTVVDEGDNCMSSLTFDLTAGANCGKVAAKFDIIALGTGGGACGAQPAETVTAVTTEITTGGGNRQNATSSTLTPASAGSTAAVALVKTFTFSSTFAVDESAVVNSSATGSDDALAVQCFTDVNVISGDTLQLTWTFNVGA